MLGIHGYYWLSPLITASVWLTNLIGLLCLWTVVDDTRQYERKEADIVFISDVGAAHHAYFIVFCALTSAFYFLTTLIERHLRHNRRIPGSVKRSQTRLDICSVVFASVGCLALIFLSVFDAFHFSRVHWSMALIFIVFTALSVFCQCWQVISLSKHHPSRKHLKAAIVIKVALLSVAIVCVIGFAATYGACRGDAVDSRCNKVMSAAAVLEWLIAFLLFFFFLTYIIDFWPARVRARKGLTEDGTMVEKRALAESAGEGHRPEAPYAVARDMGPNHSAGDFVAAGATGRRSINGPQLTEAPGY